MFELAETAFGGVDVVINNAGIMNLATIANSDDALFDRHIAVNLKGAFNSRRYVRFREVYSGAGMAGMARSGHRSCLAKVRLC
jgi:3-oxoacyl-[acyl-carrier protein] reductase